PISWRNVTGNLCRDAQSDAAATHFRQRHRPTSAIRLVGHCLLARADLFDRPREVAVPFDRVHREVQVQIDDEHKKNCYPTTSASRSTHASPATEMIVSTMLHVASVC